MVESLSCILCGLSNLSFLICTSSRSLCYEWLSGQVYEQLKRCILEPIDSPSSIGPKTIFRPFDLV